jgi:signal transduction histidine kinase
MIAMVGRPPPRFDPRPRPHRLAARLGRPDLHLQLPDGRWLVARQVRERPSPILWVVGGLALLAIAIAVGSYPVVRRPRPAARAAEGGRRAARRGDLGARVQVEGRDEVAALAASFNRSAQRIEELIAAHRLLLANCSHELRTPLARISVAASLLGEQTDPKTRDGLKRDIDELDRLIEEILLASRLEAVAGLQRHEAVDLLALAAEEAAHYDIEAGGEPVTVEGDRLLLRRLVRNLLENARRYAGDGPIEISCAGRRPRPCSRCATSGPGVPAEERERIFEPFYRRAATARAGAAAGSASPWCATLPAVTAAPWFALRPTTAAAASGSTCRRRKLCRPEQSEGRQREEAPWISRFPPTSRPTCASSTSSSSARSGRSSARTTTSASSTIAASMPAPTGTMTASRAMNGRSCWPR